MTAPLKGHKHAAGKLCNVLKQCALWVQSETSLLRNETARTPGDTQHENTDAMSHSVFELDRHSKDITQVNDVLLLNTVYNAA